MYLVLIAHEVREGSATAVVRCSLAYGVGDGLTDARGWRYRD